MLPTRPNIASLIVLFLLSECLLAAPIIHPITVLTVIWDPGANSIAYKEAAAKIDPEEVLGHMPKSKDH
ncbi:hypothetical protein LMH87_000496 [Akanthomyces muscarius]|uniref:Uncharacterized protein n=1 Tax=Akanthomyces muscarius TaxID=2231603 RepID=A0A9W8UNX1_AKAMU|nr:hypothetical protein LMH87_000496 [Akanthomyces muscarius]KAJ4155240.1 hypothetical protein LMH87_000496 [Akanthomyces muscarius]